MKIIKVLEKFSGVADMEVIKRAITVDTNLTGNGNFPTPPVDLATFKAAIDSLSTLVSEAADGGKKVIAEKNKQRETVIQMLRMLGRYVEVASKGELATFQTSGFQPASTTKATAQPLAEKIRKIAHGSNSGQLIVWIRAIRGAQCYDMRYAVLANGATPASWTTLTVTGVKSPVVLQNLTPGTTYAFQARALTKEGYTDWSDSVTFMST